MKRCLIQYHSMIEYHLPSLQRRCFVEAALSTIQFAAPAAVFQTPHAVENTRVVTGWMLVVAVLSSVLEEGTLDNAAIISGASVLACICGQTAAVSRLRGPFGLFDVSKYSFAVHPIMVPSVAVGPSVAALPTTAATASCQSVGNITRLDGSLNAHASSAVTTLR